MESGRDHSAVSKVPLVTLMFWTIKIFATTFGETGGDAMSMELDLGYAISSLIFLGFFLLVLMIQVKAQGYHPLYYWAVVVATTTVGTTTSDYIDRTLGLGYVLSSIILLALVILVLVLWKLSTGEIKYETISSPKNEMFYWITILISNTLGTALGDFVADNAGLGFEGGALVFAGLLVIVGLLYHLKAMPTSILFWAAYVLTRPLGATLGDVLTKPTEQGGLDLSQIASSVVLLVIMIALIVVDNRMNRRARIVV